MVDVDVDFLALRLACHFSRLVCHFSRLVYHFSRLLSVTYSVLSLELGGFAPPVCRWRASTLVCGSFAGDRAAAKRTVRKRASFTKVRPSKTTVAKPVLSVGGRHFVSLVQESYRPPCPNFLSRPVLVRPGQKVGPTLFVSPFPGTCRAWFKKVGGVVSVRDKKLGKAVLYARFDRAALRWG